MTGSPSELDAVLRDAAGDPYRMLQLRRLAESAGCHTGHQSDAEVVAALLAVGELARFGSEGLFTTGRTGSWAVYQETPADAPDDADGDGPAAPRTAPPEEFDQTEQSAALVKAAGNGTPFCEVCARAAQAQGARV